MPVQQNTPKRLGNKKSLDLFLDTTLFIQCAGAWGPWARGGGDVWG